jgi:EAL domain-containing protein (putative c-di-GMP-specific phosphodiesterase class I)
VTVIKKTKVLLVDDDRDFVELLSFRLESHNYAVEVAFDGETALKKAQANPDLILLDIILPKISGYDVCRKLREDKLTQQIPIIMLTAKDSAQEKVEGLYGGADDYLTKPFEPEELFARIDAVLRRTHAFSKADDELAKSAEAVKEVIEKGLVVPHFQPIFYLSPQKLLGLEVLSRPSAKIYFARPEDLFDAAMRTGLILDLEIACHKMAFLNLGAEAGKYLLFFNVSPYIITDQRYKEFSSFYQAQSQAQRIGLELTERTAITHFGIFLQSIKFFKDKGFKIVIDDVGSGYASLNTVAQTKPDFVKIDIQLVKDLDTDPVKQRLVKAIVEFCKESGIICIAEGIERKEELAQLIACQVDAGQGYLLGRPTAQVATILNQ